MDTLDMAKSLKDAMQPKPVTGNESTKTTTVFGVARGDSKDGIVDVDLGGDTISARGTAYASIPTNVNVKSGDSVMVQLVGADGTGKQPVVVGVQGGGDAAEVNTSDAIKKAEEASKKADNASAKADDASNKADSVKDTADNAEKKADEAKKESENASAKADNATGKAEEASKKADDARKYADNFISFDKSTGLVIGNQEDITSGCSTHIANDRVSIFEGEDEVASFSGNAIELGKNSPESKITLCGGIGEITNENRSLNIRAVNSESEILSKFSEFSCGIETGDDTEHPYSGTFHTSYSAGLNDLVTTIASVNDFYGRDKREYASITCDTRSYLDRGKTLVGFDAELVGKRRHAVNTYGQPVNPRFEFEILGYKSVLGDTSNRADITLTEDLATFKFVEFLFGEAHTGARTSLKVKDISDGRSVCPVLHCFLPSANVWQVKFTQWVYLQTSKRLIASGGNTRYINLSGSNITTGEDGLTVYIVDVLGYY